MNTYKEYVFILRLSLKGNELIFNDRTHILYMYYIFIFCTIYNNNSLSIRLNVVCYPFFFIFYRITIRNLDNNVSKIRANLYFKVIRVKIEVFLLTDSVFEKEKAHI